MVDGRLLRMNKNYGRLKRSDKAGFITGENICIDGGMTKLMIYHGDHGWTYTPEE